MSVSIGHLDSIADLALGLLSNLASSNEGTNLPTVPRGKQTNDSVAAKRPRSLSSTSGTEGSISDFLIGLAIPDGKEDLYGVPIGERAISHTLYQPQTSPTSSEEPSPLVSWLYLVRYALSVTVRDYRADLALSHSFRLAKALVFGVGATFLVRRWIRDRGDPDLAIKIVRPCKREEEDNILRAVGVEMKTLTNSSLVENEYIVRLKAVDWEVRMGYQHPLPILIMECAEFGDLAGYQKRPLTLRFQTKLELCLDVALGIRALHAYGFIHGDLKSENVLLFHHPKRGFIAKLSDFAFSALPTYKGEKRRLAGKSFPYNAPETDHDSESTALDFADLSLTDVYSLGMLVWRTMLDGKNPFTVDPESHEVIKVPSTREIARRKLSGILIEEACESIAFFGKDVNMDVVQKVLHATLQVQRGKRDVWVAIWTMSRACSRTESITQLSYLNIRYLPRQRPNTSSYHTSTGSVEDDYRICAASEANPHISLLVFPNFHLTDKMHAVVQKHILLAFEEIASGQSEACGMIKIMLLFIYLCGFGHARYVNNIEKFTKFYKDMMSTFKRFISAKSHEVKNKAKLFMLTGALHDLLPLQDASTFFWQILDTITNGTEWATTIPYQGGFLRSAEAGSPIARKLL